MFDLPEAKRVRRADLYANSRSRSPSTPSSPLDPSISAAIHSQLRSLYGPIDSSISAPIAPKSPSLPPAPETEEFEFRLFSTSTAAVPQKIVLNDTEEADGDGAFVVRSRDRSYYFVGTASGEKKRRFESVAVSGEEVLRGRDKRAWGLEVAWRVRILRVGFGGQKNLGGKVEGVWDGEEEDSKRKRPGKKRRIILRGRKKKREEGEEKRKRERELREEAEKEKRTRRNREKKVKRKAKEKAKKAGSGEVGNTTVEELGRDHSGDE